MMRLPVALLILVLLEPSASFTTVYRQSSSIVASNQRAVVDLKPASTVLFSSSEGEDDSPKSTSFDDAGRSLVDEEDKKRMEEMGDFDSNPNVSYVMLRFACAVEPISTELKVQSTS